MIQAYEIDRPILTQRILLTVPLTSGHWQPKNNRTITWTVLLCYKIKLYYSLFSYLFQTIKTLNIYGYSFIVYANLGSAQA